MAAIDEDLRHGLPSTGAFEHFGATRPAGGDVDLFEARAFAGQQRFGPGAIGAKELGIDLHTVKFKYNELAAETAAV